MRWRSASAPWAEGMSVVPSFQVFNSSNIPVQTLSLNQNMHHHYGTYIILGNLEVTANLYCEFAYPYWEGYMFEVTSGSLSNGNSVRGAHVMLFGLFKTLIRSRADTKLIFFLRKDLFLLCMRDTVCPDPT